MGSKSALQTQTLAWNSGISTSITGAFPLDFISHRHIDHVDLNENIFLQRRNFYRSEKLYSERVDLLKILRCTPNYMKNMSLHNSIAYRKVTTNVKILALALSITVALNYYPDFECERRCWRTKKHSMIPCQNSNNLFSARLPPELTRLQGCRRRSKKRKKNSVIHSST